MTGAKQRLHISHAGDSSPSGSFRHPKIALAGILTVRSSFLFSWAQADLWLRTVTAHSSGGDL